MIKESKYIIRKIIIGVGIALCLAFLNGCKVKAFSYVETTFTTINYNLIQNNDDYILLAFDSPRAIYKNKNNKDIVACNINGNCQYIDLTNNETLSNFNYNNIGIGLNDSSLSGSLRSDYVFLSTNELPVTNCDYARECSDVSIVGFTNQSETVMLDLRSNNGTFNSYSYFSVQLGSINEIMYTRDQIRNLYSFHSNIEWHYLNNPNYGLSAYSIVDIVLGSSSPQFLSFNALKTVHNNLLLGYTFAPEFSVFDTENYEYQYRIGLNDIWLTMNENLYEFNVNVNTTVYVRIKDKINNEVIDSSTFTITGVGNFVDSNVDYDIKFNGKYRTQNYLNNNSSGSSIIQEYEIDVTFSPDSSILKYQYQYVLNGNSIDNNGWIDVNLQPSNMGNFTTVVSQNGTLYARILDSSDNIMATGSFTINSIGKIAFDNSDDKILNKYNNILNTINFGGPISGLIDIPIKLIGTIATGLSGGLTCSDYQLGNLMGTNLKLPCVNVKSHIGESLYFTIDIIISACMAYHIIKMIFDLYNNLLFMEKNPIVDLGRRRS